MASVRFTWTAPSLSVTNAVQHVTIMSIVTYASKPCHIIHCSITCKFSCLQACVQVLPCLPAWASKRTSCTSTNITSILKCIRSVCVFFSLHADDSRTWVDTGFALSPYLKQQPLSCAVTLEAALRALACDEPAASRQFAAIVMRAVDIFCKSPAAVTAAAAAAATAAATAGKKLSKVSAAAAAADANQLPLQLFSLLTSCLKHGLRQLDAPSHSSVVKFCANCAAAAYSAGDFAAKVAAAVAANTNGRSSSRSSGRAVAAAVEPYIVLAARCMTLIGQIVSDAAAVQPIKRDGELLQKIGGTLDWLHAQLSELASFGDTQQLQEVVLQLAELQEVQTGIRQVEAAAQRQAAACAAQSRLDRSAGGTSGSSGADLDLFSSGTAQQLQQFGAAVCAQLPLSICCNNTACTSLGKQSEMHLVGGKSSVCSGCRAARYCGKECQQVHWRLHRRVCKQKQQKGG